MPRLDGKSRRSKLSEKLYRPTTHVLCCWVHGYRLQFYISGEDMPKDSNTSAGATARTLSDLYNEVGCLPVSLHFQHDNTAREAKNQYFTRFMILLTTLGAFRRITLNCLTVGHSHEDMDQVFSQVAALISNSTFSTPDELLRVLSGTCQPQSAAQSATV